MFFPADFSTDFSSAAKGAPLAIKTKVKTASWCFRQPPFAIDTENDGLHYSKTNAGKETI